MRNGRILVWLLLTGLLCCVCLHASGQFVAPPSRTQTQSASKRQGFFDYVLGKINPRDKDYGAAVETRRSGAVEHTIDDLYFWSNVVTLLLLCVMVAMVLLQWSAADKREVIAAALIAQLWNGRVSDRIEIERRTEQFNRLVEAHNSGVERSLSQEASSSQKEAQAAVKLTRSVRDLVKAGPKPSSAEFQNVEITPVAASDAGAANLEQTTLLLQRRLEALQNSEQNLKQRLNQTTVLLDQERRRNATLKGA